MRYIHKNEDNLTPAEKLQNGVCDLIDKQTALVRMKNYKQELGLFSMNDTARGHLILAEAAYQGDIDKQEAVVEAAWVEVQTLANGYVSLDSAPPSSE